MTCKLCNTKTDYLEPHHIIPRSRGGLDNESNLIKLCIDCHGLAHNVDFKRKDGLDSLAIQKKRLETIAAQKWCNDNTEKIIKKMIDLADKDIDKLHFLNYLMHSSGTFTAVNLKEFTLYNTTKVKFTL